MRSRARVIVIPLAVAAVYFAVAKMGLALALINPSASAVWPPTGLAIACALILGPSSWFGIFLGAFLVNLVTAGTAVTSLAIASGNTLEALVAAHVVNRYAGGRAAFDTSRHAARFVVLAGLLSTTISATVGVTALSLAGFAMWSAYAPIWLTWWLGDVTGAILITPFILLWTAPNLRWSRRQLADLLALLVVSCAVGWIAFAATPYPLVFLCVPVSVWAGFHFGPRHAATASCIFSGIGVWVTLHGGGYLKVLPINEALVTLQVFTATIAIVGIIVAAAVSERKQSEARIAQLNSTLEGRVDERMAALRESEDRLEEAQDVAHIGSWEWSVADNTVWWSAELYRLFGAEPYAFVPSFDEFSQRMHPEDRAVLAALLKRAVEDHQPFSAEFRLMPVDELTRTLHAQGRVVLDKTGRVHHMMGTVQDITERKRMEEQFRHAQKMEAMGRLAGGVAHDFNNILTVIDGYADLLLQQIGDDKPISGDLMEIHQAAQRGAALTRQLLAFTRKQVIQLVGVDLNIVTGSVVHMLRHTLGDDLQIVTRMAGSVRPVLADVAQLEQVLMNLAINARDAMKGGGTLTVETADVDLARGQIPDLPKGRYVRLTVADTGHGMDATVKAHLFEPFFTTKERGHGTGLGLATVFGIVQQFRGAIQVESEPGKGTTFNVYLPEADVRVAESDSLPVRSGNIVGGESILVVEDDDNLRSFVTRLLKRHGYQVDEAATPAHALHAHDRPVDLLLTDMMMPGMNGRALAKEFCERHPATQVIFMSGYSDLETPERGGPLGGAFLQKPFTSSILLRKVRETLDAHLVRI